MLWLISIPWMSSQGNLLLSTKFCYNFSIFKKISWYKWVLLREIKDDEKIKITEKVSAASNGE
jgi:hypothetical protein